MLTQDQANKFADWIIAQENKMIAARYPISPEVAVMTDEQLLQELTA